MSNQDLAKLSPEIIFAFFLSTRIRFWSHTPL